MAWRRCSRLSRRLELVRCDVKTGKFTGPQLLYPELGTVLEDATLGERHTAARAIFHRSTEWAGSAHHREPLLAATVRTRVVGTGGRDGRRTVERGFAGLAGLRLHSAWQRSEIPAAAADDIEGVSTGGGGDQRASGEAVRISRTAGAAAFGGRVRRQCVGGDGRVAVAGKKSCERPSGVPARDWQFKATPLGLALGRPIRDQVFTTRDNRPTTFQALELVNGASLEHMLRRGALRLLGQLPAAPENLFDSGRLRKGAVDFDIDITGLRQLWLLEEDAGCYDPAHTLAGWAQVELSGPGGTKTMADLAPPTFARQPVTANKVAMGEAVSMPPGSRMVLPLEGLGYTHMRGKVALDDRSTADDVEGAVRFFIFGAEPDPERLVRVAGEPPEPAPPQVTSPNEAGRQFYLQLLARKPNPAEVRVVRNYMAAGKLSPAALEDLLWGLLLHPEFQYLY